MKLLVAFISIFTMLAVNNAAAYDDDRQNRFQSFVSILGPVSIGPDQNLKLCSTDISLVEGSGAKDERKTWSNRYSNGRSKTNRVVWSSTRIEVFDSIDTTRALPVTVSDIVFASGKGACTEIPGYKMATDGVSRSVLIVLTTLTKASARFNPLVSAQLFAPNNPSAGLLLPAVQSAGGGGGGANAGTCCACAPVCGCGICD